MMELLAKHCLPMRGRADIELAMDLTGHYAVETGFNPREAIFLKLVTEEACLNVIEHADIPDPFWVKWELFRNGMKLRVIQKGSLFSLQGASEIPVVSSRGRGLSIIEGLCDTVEIDAQGSLVSLVILKTMKDIQGQ